MHARALRGGWILGVASVFALASAAPAEPEIDLNELTVSSGLVHEHLVAIPVGATVTIGTRVVDPVAEAVRGLGLSYFGWDPATVTFHSGSAAGKLFEEIPGLCLTGGLGSVVPTIVASDAFPTAPPGLPGPRRVRVFSGVVLDGAAYDPICAPGIDGIAGNGDPDFRLTFEGVAPGQTEVEIGGGDDFGGGILRFDDIVHPMGQSAIVKITVPEPTVPSGIIVASLLVSFVARRRRRLA